MTKYGLRLHWLAELIPRNRFLGSLHVYKYGHMKNEDEDDFFWIESK
jgi:hypothetical protein